VIQVTRGELAEFDVDAVLRPVSAEWEAVTAAMRRLELAAGPELAAYCQRLREPPVGSALITPAGALPARFMVHVVVRSLDEPVSASGIRRGLRNGLRRLQEWAIEHVAMAPLGTGAGNLDAEDVARIMVDELYDHAVTADYPTRVIIAAESDYELGAFQRQLAARELPWLAGPADPPGGR
jgi:O-acetyl-ADP-ribose deacetylase (regulator of RNase III)